MDVRTSVKVKNPDHPRFGEAGYIETAKFPDDSIGVKFDSDSVVMAVPLTDLQAL